MQILQENGYSDVAEMVGGMEAWIKAGYPVVASPGFPGWTFAEPETAVPMIPQ